jgi:hypothetical protein
MGERDNLRRNILYEVERVVRSVHTIFLMYMGCSGNTCVCTRVVEGIVKYIHTSSSRLGHVHIVWRQVTSIGHTCGLQEICGQRIFLEYC